MAGELKHQELVTSQTIFVVRGLKTNLLGLPAITALQLLKRDNATHTDGLKIQEWFPKLFTGLGNPGEEYTIQLKEGAVPHALYTPWKIPIPIRDQVQEELHCIENAGVNAKIDKPTPWCAGMVVVPKKSESVSI